MSHQVDRSSLNSDRVASEGFPILEHGSPRGNTHVGCLWWWSCASATMTFWEEFCTSSSLDLCFMSRAQGNPLLLWRRGVEGVTNTTTKLWTNPRIFFNATHFARLWLDTQPFWKREPREVVNIAKLARNHCWLIEGGMGGFQIFGSLFARKM